MMRTPTRLLFVKIVMYRAFSRALQSRSLHVVPNEKPHPSAAPPAEDDPMHGAVAERPGAMAADAKLDLSWESTETRVEADDPELEVELGPARAEHVEAARRLAANSIVFILNPLVAEDSTLPLSEQFVNRPLFSVDDAPLSEYKVKVVILTRLELPGGPFGVLVSL